MKAPWKLLTGRGWALFLFGVVGVVVMLGLSTGLFWALRRRGADRETSDEAVDSPVSRV